MFGPLGMTKDVIVHHLGICSDRGEVPREGFIYPVKLYGKYSVSKLVPLRVKARKMAKRHPDKYIVAIWERGEIKLYLGEYREAEDFPKDRYRPCSYFVSLKGFWEVCVNDSRRTY